MRRYRFAANGRQPALRGSALTEFALCLPILLLLFSAGIEYGFTIYNSMTLLDAAREGARLGARQFMTDAQLRARVQAYFPSRNIGTADVTIQQFNTNGAALASEPRVPGAMLKITVSCEASWLTPLRAVWALPPTYRIAAAAAYRVEL